MENASKALIIAGAILLSILLISLGIMVYNQAKGTVNNANLDSEETQTFNSKFLSYTGNRKSASDVNSLIQAVNANNTANPTTRIILQFNSMTPNTHYTGTAPATASATNAGLTSATVSSGFTYNVTYTLVNANSTFQKSGYIGTITIRPAT